MKKEKSSTKFIIIIIMNFSHLCTSTHLSEFCMENIMIFLGFFFSSFIVSTWSYVNIILFPLWHFHRYCCCSNHSVCCWFFLYFLQKAVILFNMNVVYHFQCGLYCVNFHFICMKMVF